MSSLSLLFWW